LEKVFGDEVENLEGVHGQVVIREEWMSKTEVFGEVAPTGKPFSATMLSFKRLLFINRLACFPACLKTKYFRTCRRR
jgi:hypothetical protein